jgi:hypothetical protein
MGTRWPHPLAVVPVVVALATVGTRGVGTAAAQTQEGAGEADACFTAAERAQPLMKDKRFREARAELEMCARDVCPRVARTDCRDWLTQVAASQPSVVIAAHEVNPRKESRDVVGVRATIDGGITIDRVEASPVPLDPGHHRVRIERPGFDPLEQAIDIREGEKNRVLNFTWQSTFVAAPRAGQGDEILVRPTPASVYVFGILGLAATGVGTYLEVSGLSKRSTLSACKPHCQQPEVDDALQTTRAGDLTLGIGIAMMAGATLLYVARPAEPEPPPRPQLGWLLVPTAGGLMAGLHGDL